MAKLYESDNDGADAKHSTAFIEWVPLALACDPAVAPVTIKRRGGAPAGPKLSAKEAECSASPHHRHDEDNDQDQDNCSYSDVHVGSFFSR